MYEIYHKSPISAIAHNENTKLEQMKVENIGGCKIRRFSIHLTPFGRVDNSMTVSITRTVSAQQRELEKKLKELKKLEADLTQRELDLATMRAELRAIDLNYVRKVGAKLARLDLLEARIAEILARLNPDDQVTEKRAREARQNADKRSRETKDAQSTAENSDPFKPSERLRLLYREAAKNMHPDLASDDQNREIRNQWMVEINAIYQAGDEEGLASLLEKWYASPESVQGLGTQADLERTVREIAAVTERLKTIHEELDRLKHSFAYSLRARMRAAEKEGRDLLDEMSKKIEKQIARKQRLLDDLVKNAPPVWNIEW
jgi:hypothetical protein